MSGAPPLRSAHSVRRLRGRRRFHREVDGRRWSDRICRPNLAIAIQRSDLDRNLDLRPERDSAVVENRDEYYGFQ